MLLLNVFIVLNIIIHPTNSIVLRKSKEPWQAWSKSGLSRWLSFLLLFLLLLEQFEGLEAFCSLIGHPNHSTDGGNVEQTLQLEQELVGIHGFSYSLFKQTSIRNLQVIAQISTYTKTLTKLLFNSKCSTFKFRIASRKHRPIEFSTANPKFQVPVTDIMNLLDWKEYIKISRLSAYLV